MARTKRSGWHQEDIKAEIRKNGTTLKELALSNGLSESACRMALLYQFHPSGEEAIVSFLKIHPHELWPNRYRPDGKRSIGRDRTPINLDCLCQKGTVA